MNSRERVLAALKCQQPDRVPIFEAGIDEPVILELARILGLETHGQQAPETQLYAEESRETSDLYCLIVQELGLDATCMSFSIGLRRLDGDYARDKYGSLYRLSPHGQPLVVDGPISEISDLRSCDMASRLSCDDFAGVRYVVDRVGNEKAHFVAVTDPFKTSWLLRGGMEKLLLDYSLDPALVHGLMRIATDYALAAVDMAVDLGADVIFTDGDLAGELTTLMSPRHYRLYVKPYQKEIADHAHRRGLPIVKHTDGNVWPILDDFLDIGYDGFHPVQPQCMDIAEVKRRVAGRLCLLGNIDCRNLLVFGTEQEVVDSVKETMARVAPGGGYILSSSNSIHADCRALNYIAMVRAAHEEGLYGE